MNPNSKMHSVLFALTMTIVIVGNAILLFFMARYFSGIAVPSGEWLVMAFGAEIVALLALAWKRQLRNTGESGRLVSVDASSDSKIEGIHYFINAGGLKKFIPSRKYYSKAGSLFDDHIESCKHSLTMVSINLMTGLPHDGLLERLHKKLEMNSRFRITISLLNPNRIDLMTAMGANLSIDPAVLAQNIRASLADIKKFKSERISAKDKKRMSVRVHNIIPFASAILKDEGKETATIQVETKIYGAAIGCSFSFEFAPGSESQLYETLTSGYNKIIKNGELYD